MNAEDESSCEIVVERSYRRVIMYVAFGLIALGALMLMSSEPAEAYTVTGTETWIVDTYWSESIIIDAGGVLNVQNANVYMQPNFDGQWAFEVRNGGTLNLNGATITHDALFPFHYDFIIWDGATASFINSGVSYAGGGFFPGMVVLSGDITMNGCSFVENMMVGMVYVNDTTGFTMTNCYVANNDVLGVYIMDGGASDYYFTFNGGTVIENNVEYGIYVDLMTNKNFGLTLQDTRVLGHDYNVYLQEVNIGSAFLDFQSSDLVNSLWANVWVDTMVDADFTFTAFNTHFDSSISGYGVFINSMGGLAGSNLAMSMDSSFVLGNGDTGIHVATVSNGWQSYNFINTYVENNFGNGLITAPLPVGNVMTFSAVGSSFSGNSLSGAVLNAVNPGSVSVSADYCDFLFNGGSGLVIDRVTNGDKSVAVTNSWFEGNGAPDGAVVDWGINGGTAAYLIGSNEFNNSYAAIYFAGSLETAANSGNTLTFDFNNNWLVSGLGPYGVYFASPIQNFDETILLVNDNHFWGQESRNYGIHFNSYVVGDFNYWHNLTIGVNGNEFFELDQAALWFGDIVWGFRYVDISMNSNILIDTDFDYEFGLILNALVSDTGYDTYLNLVSNNNVYMGLGTVAFYVLPVDYRHVNMDISSNIFDGLGNTDAGIMIDGLYYDAPSQPSDLVLNLDNNEFYDFNWDDIGLSAGIWLDAWGAPLHKDVDMTFTNNHFNGTGSPAFVYGILFLSSIYHSSSEINSLNLVMDNNEFIELLDTGVAFWGPINNYLDVNLAFTNNLFENRNNIWMYMGIYIPAIYHTDMSRPTSLTLTLDGNSFFDITYAGLHFDEPIWGIRNVTIVVDRNTFENRIGNIMDYGIYFPAGPVYDTNDYDNHFYFYCRENTIRDMSEDGIRFDSWTPVYGFRHVNIQIRDNLMENVMDVNNMNFGILFYYEIFYSTSMYDSSFVIDITGNVVRDLGWDGIAFRYNAGWEFGMFTNVSVNIRDNVFTNQLGGGMDYGIYLRPFWSGRDDVDNLLDVTIVNNTFDSLTMAGIHFAAYIGVEFEGYRTVNFVISQNEFTNTAGHWMVSGVVMQGFVYWDSSYANSLYFEISDNTFSDLSGYGVHIGGQIFYYSQVDINTFGNYFSDSYNDFDMGVYFTNDIFYDLNNDGYFHFTSIGNEFYDLASYGFYFSWDIFEFRNVTIEVQNNIFANTISNWMDRGIYFNSVYYDDTIWDNYFILDMTNNRFENLSQYGLNIGWIFGYRHVTIDIVNNHFSDIYNSFDYGVYFMNEISHDVFYPGSFTANIVGNTFMDLAGNCVYFTSDVHSFRSVWINVDNNDFLSYQGYTIDEGVRFSNVYYFWADDQDSIFILDVTNNNYENLTNMGFGIEWIYFRHVTVNVVNNQYSDVYNTFNYGFYSGSISFTTDFDSDLTINILDNTVHDLYQSGITFYEIYNYRNVLTTIDNNDFICTISNWLDYGVYIDYFYYDNPSHDTYLQLALTNNNFENLTQFGFVTWDVYGYRHVTIDILNNYFSEVYNSFDFGWFLGGVYFDDSYANTDFHLNVRGNEFRDLYQWGGGAYFGGASNYHTTAIDVDNNDFICTQSSRMYYGIIIGNVEFYDTSFDNYLWMNFTNNNFENIYEYGITVYEIYGFRHVYLDFLDNTFSDIYNSFWCGIYIGEDTIHYDTSYDSELHVNLMRNTFQDLNYYGLYIEGNIYDFRNMWITIEYNDFINTIGNWMDYGVRFQSIYYNTNSHNSYLYFDVNNNTFQSLNNHGIYVSQIYNIRHVDIDILYNIYSDIYDSFNYGFYVSSDMYYTTSYPGSFDLLVSNNNFNDLTSYAIRFNQIRNFQDTDMVVQDNDFSGSNYGFLVSGGVDYAYDWYLLFTRNNGDYMDGRMLYISGTSSGSYGLSRAQIVVQYNTMSNSWDGFNIGDIGYYDLSAGILIENNDLLDMYNGYGIELGWYYDGPGAYISIQGNTITGNMYSAIYFEGCEDMPFVMDIVNNDFDGVQTAIYIDAPVYGDNMFSVGTVNIMQNNIFNLKEYGIYVGYMYWGLLDLNVENNWIRGDPVAYYGVTFFYFDYADWSSISNIEFTGNTMQDGFYGFYFDYQGSGSMITLDVVNTDVTNTLRTFYFYNPISSSSDVFSVRIRKSTFTDSQLSFFYLNDPGYGLFIVDITDCHVLNYGSMGGYGFYMAQNDGGYIRIDVYSTEFIGSPSRLGDAFAGSGQVLINFWYIDGITSGVANDWNQRIQVLWDVDVEVYIGSDYTTPAGPGIIVYAEDQFWFQSFYTTTSAGGTVTGQTVAGVLITYSGSSFSGQAVHTFYAVQGTFSGSAIGTFNANGTIAILLPGDNDGDGLNDAVDIDDDNDGVPDVYDRFPFDPNEWKDTDNDGIGDNADDDDDGDGIPDLNDAFPDNPLEWSDIDGDGVGDNTDIDIDGDGIPNIVDTSPYNNTGFQDSDGDGTADAVDAFPYNPNEWSDSDQDGIGNNADNDDDNDGVPDDADLYPFDSSRTETITQEETTINVDLDKAPDWTAPVSIIIIGAILVLLMWLLFGRRRRPEEEEIMPSEEPTEEEGLEEEPEPSLDNALDEILSKESSEE